MMKLSVIIPGYNTRQEWWVRCVRSVAIAAAKVGEYEIVCIDDGSNVPVQKEWFEGIDGVRLIREDNKGLPTARNVGIENSTGEFLTFVDSDDEVRADSFKLCIEAIKREGADLAAYGLLSLFLDAKFAVHDVPEYKYYGALSPRDVAYLVKRRLFYYSCNKVFRREFLVAHKMRFNPEGVPQEDAIFNVALVTNKAKWVTVNYEGYKYYRYDGSIVSRYKPTYMAGTRACTAAWRVYKAETPGAREQMDEFGLGWYDETSDEDIRRRQWINIWRVNTPYNLMARWQYAKENADVLGSNTFLVFVKQAIKMFLRRYCYFKPIQRWHQKRFVARIGAHVVPLTKELIES